MRKLLMSVCILILCAASYVQSADPFTTGEGTRWQGRIAYKDANGINRNDLYELILVPNGTCIVTVSDPDVWSKLVSKYLLNFVCFLFFSWLLFFFLGFPVFSWLLKKKP